MRVNVIEVVVGAIVLSVAALFLVFAYTSSRWHHSGGYTLYADFDRIDGLSVGSDVRVSGVKVGAIVGVDLEPSSFLARVKIALDARVKVPKDSVAEVVGEGLLGPRYLSIVPGGSEEDLKAGQKISRTQAAVSLESLISKFLFSKGEEKSDEDGQKNTPIP